MPATNRVCLTIALTTAAVLGTLLAAKATQAGLQEKYFDAVQTGNIQNVTSQMRPELLVEIDEPVLQAWVNAFNEQLGPVQSMKYTGLKLEQTENGPMRSTTAIVTFERGTATSELTAVDGKLISFNVTSEELSDDWFQGPTTTELYQRLGQTFIERFQSGQTSEAYEMCHPALQEVIDRESFQQMIDIVREEDGSLQSVTFKDSRMEITDDGQNLMLNYEIASENGTGTCEIKVQFVGMKGHLLGFQFD